MTDKNNMQGISLAYHLNCYLCNSTGDLLYQGLRDRLFAVPGEWNIRRCQNPECGLLWLDPMPTKEDIVKVYQSYYTHGDGNDKEKQFVVIWNILRDLYRLISLGLSMITRLDVEQQHLDDMYLTDVKPGKLLDIGCGDGKYLAHMRSKGWRVEGVDIDPVAAKYVREKLGIIVHFGELEKLKFPDNSFDAITMNHVIEHLHDPASFVRECHRILKVGGKLVMATPNVNSWGHRKFGINWLSLEPPRHLHLFSQKTLKDCLYRSGFKSVITWTTAVNAASVFIASLGIKRYGRHNLMARAELRYYLKGLILQYCELFATQTNHDLGEEVVLVGNKL